MKLEAVGSGMGFTEGPVFMQDGRLAVVSIDQGRIYSLRPGERAFQILTTTEDGPNGLAEGADGSLYVAQNGGRWNAAERRPRPGATGGVQRVDQSGVISWITRDPVSPNDLCFGPDGFLYVTDPTRQLLDDGRIWRCDVATGAAEILVSVDWYPNGVGFGREDDALYVASTRDRRIVRFVLTANGLGPPEAFVRIPRGRPDGFAFDVKGNLVICVLSDDDQPGELQVWSSDAKLLDTFRPGTGRRYTNVAIAGDARAAITDSATGQVLLATDWPTSGLALHPFRKPAELFENIPSR